MRNSPVTKVAILTNRILDYRFPVFEALHKDCNLEIKIFLTMSTQLSTEAARRTLSLKYSQGLNFNHRTFHRDAGVDQKESLPVPVMLPFELYFYRPDIVISGEFGLRSTVGWMVARSLGIPFVIWTEEIIETARGINALQKKLRSFLIPRTDAFLTWGVAATQYMETWNIQKNIVYRCAQAVDNEFWFLLSESVDRLKVRERFVDKGKIFLAVGQLIPRKGFDLFLKAWGKLPDHLKVNNSIVFAGCGEEEQKLKRIAVESGIRSIHFVGQQEPKALAALYAASDVLVFPSLVDVWGMVVNEAMACGLPVLASRYAGASQELIAGTGAGELIDPLDVEAFSKALERWCSIDLSRMQIRAREVIKDCNVNVTINAFRRVVQVLTSSNGKA